MEMQKVINVIEYHYPQVSKNIIDGIIKYGDDIIFYAKGWAGTEFSKYPDIEYGGPGGTLPFFLLPRLSILNVDIESLQASQSESIDKLPIGEFLCVGTGMFKCTGVCLLMLNYELALIISPSSRITTVICGDNQILSMFKYNRWKILLSRNGQPVGKIIYPFVAWPWKSPKCIIGEQEIEFASVVPTNKIVKTASQEKMNALDTINKNSALCAIVWQTFCNAFTGWA